MDTKQGFGAKRSDKGSFQFARRHLSFPTAGVAHGIRGGWQASSEVWFWKSFLEWPPPIYPGLIKTQFCLGFKKSVLFYYLQPNADVYKQIPHLHLFIPGTASTRPGTRLELGVNISAHLQAKRDWILFYSYQLVHLLDSINSDLFLIVCYFHIHIITGTVFTINTYTSHTITYTYTSILGPKQKHQRVMCLKAFKVY